MNKNTSIIIAVIIIAGLLGWIAYSMNNPGAPSETPTSTPVTTVPNPHPQPNPSPQAGVPSVSTDPSAVPTDTTVVMTGSIIPNGALTNYSFEYGKTSSLGSGTPVQGVGSGYEAIKAPAYLKGLAADTQYYFRLIAQNQYGSVAGSEYSFRTTQGTPAPTGSAPLPKTLNASVVTRTAANLNGSVDPNLAPTEYWFEYGTTSALGNTTSFVSVGSGDSAVPVSASVSNLDPQTTYYFRVNAQNRFGTINGSILTLKTVGPAVSAVPTVSTKAAASVSSNGATLRGSVDPNGAETNYWFEYSRDSLLGLALITATPQSAAGKGTGVSQVSADISGLSPKTDYFYRIVAENTLGTARGDISSFKTK